MKASIDLFKATNALADCLLAGLSINVSNKAYSKKVSVTDTDTGERVSVDVWPDGMKIFQVRRVPQAARSRRQHVATPKSAVEAIENKKSSKWWSRFNFEHNIMKMCWLALQDQFPGDQRFPQATFAGKLASMMSWQPATASRHINRAAKLGIVNRIKVGSAYYVTGLNDNRPQGQQQAAREQTTGSNIVLDEGKPALEAAIEQRIDESLLP